MFDDRGAMIEVATKAACTAADPSRLHDRLDHVLSRIAAGDRTAFRRLYAFMATRVWHRVSGTPLGPANAGAVTRSTFVEVWHLAGSAERYDARDWIAAIADRRVNDRLRIIDAGGRSAADPDQRGIASDSHHEPSMVADHDTHTHRELASLLGAGGATIRTSPGVFVRIDDLDHTLATIAAMRARLATVARPSIELRPPVPASTSRR